MTATAFTDVPDRLAHYTLITRRVVERYLTTGRPREYLYDPMRDYLDRGGKGIRPALLLATCEAFGRRCADAAGAAASVEMLHTAFLIHDDIEDDSPLRRHSPTLHAIHGLPLALNAGDALAVLALQPIRRDEALGPRVREMVTSELVTTIRQTTEGQALELGWRRAQIGDLAPIDYIALAGKKTCWYTTVLPLRLGAIIGSYGTAHLAALSRFGFFLGLAFQTRDDLLDVERRDAPDKMPFDDIREGKHTLLLIHLLASAGPGDRSWLREFLARRQSDRPPADCARVAEMMHGYGSVDYARQFASEMANAARLGFAEAFAQAPARTRLAFLRHMIDFILERGN
ncbi:MAG TPA: polyprenyl synthetase family protein [Nakamurella sp.]